jgi:hypothetical protein
LAAPLPLVRSDGTTYAIFHDQSAPPSVAQAAAELQDYLCKAAKAKLAIVHEPRQPMVCLGENAAARAAGLSAEGIPVEGFRIVTKGANLYVLGPDTKEGEPTPGGGTSTGTRNGVYAFLEKFVGVRWLMPGEHGDYVPTVTELTIPETDITDAPFFLNRRVPYTQESRPEVKRWWARQRLGWSLYLHHSHNWTAVPTAAFDAHPDWFAERGGVRVPPTGRYKLCVTNPGLVRAFADAAIRFFDERPTATCFSLSPADSAGWCECPNCTKLYETDPNGDLSITPAILTFYNEVAKLVAVKYPGKLLAGYVYAQYVFPPTTPIKLEPNVFLVWAPSFDYGFTLFRPALQQQWAGLLPQWTKVTENLSYYDLPVNLEAESGALNPPGLKILKFLYPRLKAAGIKGVYVYGIDAWGRAAPLNYLLAKLAWDPDADVEALLDEYCAKAYAEGGADINRLFRLLDAEVERHFVAFPDARYTLTTDMMKDIYARNLPEIERLYRAAGAKVTDSDAAARIRMIGDNLTVLHWNLRQFKLLDDPKASSFYLSDAGFFSFLADRKDSLALQPTKAGGRSAKATQKLLVSPAAQVPNAEDAQPFLLRGDQHLVLYPTGAGKVEVRFSRLTARGKLVSYEVYGADGASITSGLMSAELPVALDAAGSAHYHLLIAGGAATFMVEVTGAAWAVDQRAGEQGLHLLSKVTPLYFEVPKGTTSFSLSVEATPPGETCLATLHAPDGHEVAQYDCTAVSVDRKEIKVGPDDAGWWKLVIKPAPTGVVDDVYVQVSDELSGYFSIAPEQALSVGSAR